MQIYGMKGISLIDYPGKIAAVLYTSRCNFKCPFCHNRQLVLGEGVQPLEDEAVLAALSSRRGMIEGVVITGGEPTVHSGIGETIAAVREMGLAVKLDTNGYRPDVLEKLIAGHSVDYIAMDVKTSRGKYSRAAGIDIDFKLIERSIGLLKKSGIEHEFRTTCVPGLVTEDDILEISMMLGTGSHYTLQQFQPCDTLDKEYAGVTPYPPDTLRHFCEAASAGVGFCRVIGI